MMTAATFSLVALVFIPLASPLAIAQPANGHTSAFCSRTWLLCQNRREVRKRPVKCSSIDDTCDPAPTSDVVTELIKSTDEAKTAKLIAKLEESYAIPSQREGGMSPFIPLLGLYSVSAVLTAKPGDNPVGGKWTRKEGLAQKLLRTKATYQHLLPVNAATEMTQSENKSDMHIVAKAINVITLEAIFGLIRINVILRGDATPLSPEDRSLYEAMAVEKSEERKVDNKVGTLSPLAVKVNFDPPRIVFGKGGRVLNLNLGPRSSVILDTTYCDDRVRIGKGGTSGTRFVFRRICDGDASVTKEGEANEWRALLARRPLRKSRALGVLGACLGWGLHSIVRGKARVIGSAVSVLVSLLSAAVLFSSGGIERDDDMNIANSADMAT